MTPAGGRAPRLAAALRAAAVAAALAAALGGRSAEAAVVCPEFPDGQCHEIEKIEALSGISSAAACKGGRYWKWNKFQETCVRYDPIDDAVRPCNSCDNNGMCTRRSNSRISEKFMKLGNPLKNMQVDYATCESNCQTKSANKDRVHLFHHNGTHCVFFKIYSTLQDKGWNVCQC